ncbi:acetoacetate--CoA ligase [Sansalvadorimonas sp. 2012CJ34-2]|uniref:Acetoacetate--CoA ligase n=1 Tax=Parendozoicomonas callyspongiae TaxID=2942213 RepID=A0ABT0PEU8_9GAMM|nr:acetoacetate--CoA ligase [Sansalvadorimonas sp. 2012CJ34-2]MCL6269895.1 acetoacetate--CoA ligase [Sansalvadorimonas sp. 2012CJ34-2]
MSIKPLWSPAQEQVKSSHLWEFMQAVNQHFGFSFNSYDELYEWSCQSREEFWPFLAKYMDISLGSYSTVVDESEGMFATRWFPGATVNYAEQILRHTGDKAAIVFCCENGDRRELSRNELRNTVARAANALTDAGIKQGDRIAGFMPNMPETILMMLASASIGAIWSSCSPDFGSQGVLDRFGQIEPRILIAADGYHYNGKIIDCRQRIDEITHQISSIEQVVVVPFFGHNPDISSISNAVLYKDFLSDNTELKCVALPFNHPLAILYSSGTTGVPKCIVHGHGGTLLQHSKELKLHTDLGPEDVFFYFTTCGWMMWNWLASGLLTGATLVLYDGSPFYPGPRVLWEMAEREGVTVFGTSARYLTALQKSGYEPGENCNLSKLKAVLSTGSPLPHEGFEFVYSKIGSDLMLSSISGGTDIISCFALGNPLRPVYPGQLQCRGLGMDVAFVDDRGEPVTEERGELVCRKSFPSRPVMFWNDPKREKYRKAYFSRFETIWAHGDYGELTSEDGVVIHGRSDAVLNPGGVRIGTAEIYRQVEKVDEVLESLAVGQKTAEDERVILFVRLRDNLKLDDRLVAHIKKTIRSNTTPRHVPSLIIQAPDLPRTVSGKLTELAIRALIHGETVNNTDALANPESLDFFRHLPQLETA